MARRKPQPKNIAKEVFEEDIDSYIRQCYALYGTLTLEDRALPDYRDGLLKVYRRGIYVMSSSCPAKGKHVKSAKIVGEIMGNYHPHGDAPVYGSLVTMANMPNKLADGLGNFGSQFDNAAASRYTNIRLSDFGQRVLADQRYLPVCDLVDNYDSSKKEPLLLPALLPNVLLNGVSGIAVGLSTHIPSFEALGVKRLLRGMLTGKKLTVGALKRHLKPVFAYGGYCDLADSWQSGVEGLIERGKGSLIVYCEFTVSRGCLDITAIPPRMRQESLIDKLVDSGLFTTVADVFGKDTETPAHIKCLFKKNISVAKVEEWCDDNLYVSIPYQIAVVKRYLDPTDNKIHATVHQWGIRELLENWLEWRLELESKMLAHAKELLLQKIAKKELLLLAQTSRAIIAKSWDADNQNLYIQKALKISQEDARFICDLKVSQLSKLDRDKLKQDIAAIKQEIKEVEKNRKNVKQSVLATLDI